MSKPLLTMLYSECQVILLPPDPMEESLSLDDPGLVPSPLTLHLASLSHYSPRDK